MKKKKVMYNYLIVRFVATSKTLIIQKDQNWLLFSYVFVGDYLGVCM